MWPQIASFFGSDKGSTEGWFGFADAARALCGRLGAMRTALVFIAIAVTSGCSWILAHDPPLPVNSNTYVTCPTGIKCLADGQECPLTGTTCIDTPPVTCSVPPCAMAKLRDGGTPRDAGDASSDAQADR
jgi:uncharacterized protein YceK